MKKLTLISLVASLLFFSAPILANAQDADAQIGGFYGTSVTSVTSGTSGTSGSINTTYLLGYKTSIVGIINGIIVPVLIAIAFLVFIWGIYKSFIMNAASESEKGEGKQIAMWGIIGFVIIFSLWGLVNIVTQTLNINQAGSNAPAYPKL